MPPPCGRGARSRRRGRRRIQEEAILRRRVVVRLRNEGLEPSTHHSREDRAPMTYERLHGVNARHLQNVVIEDAEKILLELLRDVAVSISCCLHEASDVGRQAGRGPSSQDARYKQTAGLGECDGVGRGISRDINRWHHDCPPRAPQPRPAHLERCRSHRIRNQRRGGGHVHNSKEEGHVQHAHVEVLRPHRCRRARHRDVATKRRREALQTQLSG